ncbi:50S ribosomal protein L1 [Candidatus Azoamicus ciliaticola]|uniref:Large ribosomal subunit protein uL1 n=1 Tax=Candidatus Azoamicus ciliaticola TaxID=2652803 RepID=A0A6J5JX60_9GAMM|nr:50S ribosomal protein L1 [Candidatus Azoamicus ciliaticola]CAB3976515.1 50S ribosomal protein L1 [Candidatus Azoamicus ciliaticola]
MNKKNKETNKNQIYSFEKAIDFIKNLKKRNFKESIDVAIQLNIVPNKKNISIKGHAILPNKINENKKIAAFLISDNEINEAKDQSIEIILNEKNIPDFTKKNINFDLMITTPNAIIKMGKLNKILGSKNLMPDIKYGTITTNIKETLSKIRKNYVKFKNDKNDIIHSSIGKIDLDTNKLKENLETLINEIKKYKPQNCKNMSIKKIHISSTMGCGLEINLNSLTI